MLTIRIISALLGVFMLPAPSCSQTCIGEFCFTKPSEMKNFEDSRSWCQANNSTLADINDTGIQMAVFLSQLNIDSQMFINMKLSRRNGNTWFLVNGTNYLGNVQNDNESAYYELYSYLKPHANAYASLNEFLVEASKPSVLRYNLCEFEGSRCLSNSTSNFLFNNRCYVKYDNESLTWFKARERCIDNGGDIAQFQKGLNPWIPPFNTDWMNISLSYWAGIRRSGWSWKYSGDNNEVMQTSWSAGEPNNVNFACVCVDPKDNPPWMWSDCDCATPRPFVCLQIVPTTTVITTTLATTTMTTRTPIPTTTASDPTGYTNIDSAGASKNELSKDKKIGLGVGIGGGGLIIIAVIIIVLAVVITRRKRKSNDNSESRPAVDDNGENDEEGVFMLPTPSCSQTCIGEFCLTKPSEMKNFDDARSWCQANNSTLASINDTGIQMAVSQFLNSLNIDSQMFINMKLSQQSGNTWFLVNGSYYLGTVNNQDYFAYKQYSYLKPNMNGNINEFLVEASKPSVLRCNLCEFEGTRCMNNSTNNFLFNNRCFVKYDNENLTWYKARERCIDNGGDIAQFPRGSNPYIPPFNTDWMNPSLTYWAGIRWNDWSWKYSDGNGEVIYTSWSDGEPNNVANSCVCVDAKGNPPWTWSDCDCATPRPFVCLKIVPTTTVITTTPATTTMTSVTTRTPIPTTTASDPTGYTDIGSARASKNELSKDKKIGLGVGIGGGVLVIIIVIIIVLAVVVRRRKRKSNDNSESRPAVEDSGENYDEGQSNQATESNGKDLYSQVHKPPRNQVTNSHGKDVYAQVNKPPKNQINNDVYAEVVPSANQQTNKTESLPEILYSSPEFVHDTKSPTTDSDYDVACRVHEPDMLPIPRGQIQSIFPIRYSNQHANDEEAD